MNCRQQYQFVPIIVWACFLLPIIPATAQSGPTLHCHADLTVNTDPWQCCATNVLPDAVVQPGCSPVVGLEAVVTGLGANLNDTVPGLHTNPDTIAVFTWYHCLPLGSYLIHYTARDTCGQAAACSVKLTVVDYTPPILACDFKVNVSIYYDDPADCYAPYSPCAGAGVSRVAAKLFDDGSYDNCNNLKFTIKREAPYSDCVTNLDPCEKLTALAEADTIKFYCCEVGSTQQIILTGYQTDADGQLSKLPDGSSIYNQCLIQVTVVDKTAPVCIPPVNVTVSCENFNPDLSKYGKAHATDNCCLDETKSYMGQCGLTYSVDYSAFDTMCSHGTIVRNFQAFDCHGQTSKCSQRITVKYSPDYWIRFPDDQIATACDGTDQFGAPVFYGKGCKRLKVTYEDKKITNIPGACYQLERTWKIINLCHYDSTKALIEVPNPQSSPTFGDSLNLPGPIVSPCDSMHAGWQASVVKVNPDDSQPTEFCYFWFSSANGYQYTQLIRVVDTVPPEFVCPPDPATFCDLTANDSLLWNEPVYLDTLTGRHDLCDGPVDLSITGTDLCTGADIDIQYELSLDLDHDGTPETVVSSASLPGWNKVYFNNANNPNYTGGTPRAFDERPVSSLLAYGFAIQTSQDGRYNTAAVRWNTQAMPNTYTIPELPYGKHRIKWILRDPCGNQQVCAYDFTVKDCKSPDLTCKAASFVNIGPNELASPVIADFLTNAHDNCTPADQLKLGMRIAWTNTGFPLDSNNLPITQLTFSCADQGPQQLEIWAMDGAGNVSSCLADVMIQDNAAVCPVDPNSVRIAGVLATETMAKLSLGLVDLTSAGGLQFHFSCMTDATGRYNFNKIPYSATSTITPSRNDNPLNGVSTYDLVLISKHILGIQPLDSPYKIIAADANGNGSVTTFDIVELRKLILGLSTTLANNTSWRFVDKSYVFPNPAYPFSPAFPENISLPDLTDNVLTMDFVAIKIGDVNGSAAANAETPADDRSAGTLLFDVDDRTVQAGESVKVHFQAAEKVQGYQFTLNFPGLGLIDVQPGRDMAMDHFGVFKEQSLMTTSYDAPPHATNPTEFDVVFRVLQSGKLSDMLRLSSQITKAEAYSDPDGRLMHVAFRFKKLDGYTVSRPGFELYQNQPNPFADRTVIGFYLPEAASARLTILDATGRLLYTEKGDFGHGYNVFSVSQDQINANGVLYYKVETSTDGAVKRMILVK
jgi:hypothetical protein